MTTSQADRQIKFRYRQTKKGVIRNIFAHIKERVTKFHRELGFSSDDLLEWCMAKDTFHELYDTWASGGYNKSDKPSIDRIDPLRGYTFDNIQVTTYKFNRDKGDKEKEILWGKPIEQLDLSGNVIKRFDSIKQAVIELDLNQSLVSAVLLGKRNKTGGFKFRYQNSNLLQG